MTLVYKHEPVLFGIAVVISSVVWLAWSSARSASR